MHAQKLLDSGIVLHHTPGRNSAGFLVDFYRLIQYRQV